jgi:flagellar basal body-associated protein FliL
MKEEMGITVLGALGIIAAVVLAGLLIWHLQKQQKPGPQSGQAQEPNKPA